MKRLEDDTSHVPNGLINHAENSMAKLHQLTRSAEKLEQLKNLPDAEKNKQLCSERSASRI